MLLCNAIVGNYGEISSSDIIKRFSNNKNRIYDHASTNYLNIIFRIFPSNNDNVNCLNKGLILRYFTSNNFNKNEKIISLRNHYLIPIFNENNEISYWISNKNLKLRQDKLHFSLSSYVKEYWKYPMLCDEYYISNNNIIYSTEVSDCYDIDYRRKIKLEREDKIQTLCINLQYRNEEFIKVEYLNEHETINKGNINVIDLNNRFDHENSSNGELRTEEVNKTESPINNNEIVYNISNKLYSYEKDYEGEEEYEIEIKTESENESEDEYIENKSEIKISNKKGSNVNAIIDDIDELSVMNNNIIIDSRNMNEHEKTNINHKNDNCSSPLEDNIDSEYCSNSNLNAFSVCNEVSLNIENQDKNLKFGKDVQNIIDIHQKNLTINTNNYISNNKTLETIDDMITPVIKQVKGRNKYDKDFDIQPRTDIINKSEFYSIENDIYSKNLSRILSVPSKTKISNNTIVDKDNNVNRELIILNRIESTRKNVNLSNKMSVHKKNDTYDRHIKLSMFNNMGIDNSYNYKNVCNTNYSNNNVNSNTVNIDLLSNKFNRIIGKTDFLLEQLNSNNNLNFNYYKFSELKYDKEQIINRLLHSTQGLSSSHSIHNNSKSFIELNKHDRKKVDTFEGKNSYISNENLSKRCLELSRESCLSIINDDNKSNNVNTYNNVTNIQIKDSNSIVSINNKHIKDNISVSDDKCNKLTSTNSYSNIDENNNINDNMTSILSSDENIENDKVFDIEISQDKIKVNKGFNVDDSNSIYDPELMEIDFYLNENRSINTFSIMNIILSKWSGIPSISKI